MIKRTLAETILCVDTLPALSRVDNKIIEEEIIKDYTKNPPKEVYDDVPLRDHTQITWVMDYTRSKFKITNDRKTLIPLRGIAKIHKTNESSYKKTYWDPFNLATSPDFIVIYCANAKSGEVVIEYENYRKGPAYWKVPMEKNKIIIFNGNLNFFMTKNEDKEDRITFIMPCQFY
jgi:hypothetical protein